MLGFRRLPFELISFEYLFECYINFVGFKLQIEASKEFLSSM